MRRLLVCLVFWLAGCAATTSIVLLDPQKKYPPTQSVKILLKPPSAPYTEIAKLESKGAVGEAEPSVLEDARTRAREVGADAIIVVETIHAYEPPIVVYDPWPPYLPWYHDRWHGYRYWYYPAPFPYAFGPQVLPGGNTYTIHSIAIKYDKTSN